MTQQHTSPCGECPFRRSISSGAQSLGGSTLETYIGQIHGPFWLPCHMHSDFQDPNWKSDRSKPQCAGAAIHRSNVGVASMMPEGILRLPANAEEVFETPAEFFAHHMRCEPIQAQYYLAVMTPKFLMMREMYKAQNNIPANQ